MVGTPSDFRLVLENVPAALFRGYADGSVDLWDRKAEAMEFFSNPDPDQYDSFEEWFTAIAEDSLVLDAIALHLVPSTGKGHGPCGSNIGALAALDGATIKPLLNEWGARLRPPLGPDRHRPLRRPAPGGGPGLRAAAPL